MPRQGENSAGRVERPIRRHVKESQVLAPAVLVVYFRLRLQYGVGGNMSQTTGTPSDVMHMLLVRNML